MEKLITFLHVPTLSSMEKLWERHLSNVNKPKKKRGKTTKTSFEAPLIAICPRLVLVPQLAKRDGELIKKKMYPLFSLPKGPWWI